MLAELENKRTSLLTKFNPTDRLVLEVEQQIANTRKELEHAQQMKSQEHSSDVNPVWQQVTGSIVQNQSERQALKGRRAQLAQQVEQLQQELSRVEGTTVAFTTLRQKVTELENNYQLYAQKRDEAQMADAMDEERLLNVAVAQEPTFSITPFSPKPLLDIALGVFTAMFLASFLVFFAEMGRATIATPRELDGLSRYPLLATVPVETSRRRIQAERPARSSRRTITLTPDASHDFSTKRPAFESLREEAEAS